MNGAPPPDSSNLRVLEDARLIDSSPRLVAYEKAAEIHASAAARRRRQRCFACKR